VLQPGTAAQAAAGESVEEAVWGCGLLILPVAGIFTMTLNSIINQVLQKVFVLYYISGADGSSVPESGPAATSYLWSSSYQLPLTLQHLLHNTSPLSLGFTVGWHCADGLGMPGAAAACTSKRSTGRARQQRWRHFSPRSGSSSTCCTFLE
jgi:hypothetical protein